MTDKSIDELVEAMSLAGALHAKYLGAVGKESQARGDAGATKATAEKKRVDDIKKAAAVYESRIRAIDKKYETEMAEADLPVGKAQTETIKAYDAIVAQQKRIMDDHNAVVDLLNVKAKGGGAVLSV